ncbi:universal stress protein [Loigolactobacillus backii]|uniref:Universal stress protein n=1 Tax=Loigolactobacillus backii TaxID=375175 RepID=A0A192H4N5_9LACO|nr:universal stress protein [Loigolactobacillus backii]ANK59776.1 universal stress protein UspA [Loigolactobacillus backii]ANK63177.1 universal stress protein UspA [Loigolactobacillus backii]ANK64771.1 universal stress protein UspA [Loigolactobacillus backii]ANK66780.1 universal stress protein UspA [Loigolactobacillus backii]ANK69817.1 universal stress protein UspA [Loigolactobacillus backii]
MLQQYKHILVAIDGSYEAELAFRKAVEVAKRNDAELYLVHVVDTRAFQNVSSFDSAMVEQVTETAKKTMEQYITTAKENGLNNVNYSIEYGAPKVIVAKEVPKEHDIDLIMIGATGLNAVERLLIGSVTEYVTRAAVCDVLVVRTDLDNKPALNQAGKKSSIQAK